MTVGKEGKIMCAIQSDFNFKRLKNYEFKRF